MRSRFAALLVLVALVSVPAAFADGDPASDFLLTQSAYVSPDSHIPASASSELTAMLASAKKQGFPLKVAVIVTRYDLGSVQVLYKKPQTYARFLSEEIYYYTRGELLVVMPNGYGIYKSKGSFAADKAVIAKLPALDTNSGPALAAAAASAVQALAAHRGLTLSSSLPGSGTSHTWLYVGGGVAVLLLVVVVGAWLVWRRRRGASGLEV